MDCPLVSSDLLRQIRIVEVDAPQWPRRFHANRMPIGFTALGYIRLGKSEPHPFGMVGGAPNQIPATPRHIGVDNTNLALSQRAYGVGPIRRTAGAYRWNELSNKRACLLPEDKHPGQG
jgi:hypothetical protein